MLGFMLVNPATGSEQTVRPVSAVASGHDGNVPANTLDDRLSTRWSATGNNANITFDLGSTKTVQSARIAFYKGDARQAEFRLDLSVDGVNWATTMQGRSSGRTNGYQTFELGARQARYLRYVGFGNTQNDWNSLTEVRAVVAPGNPGPGDPTVPPTNPPGPGAGDRPPSENFDLRRWYLSVPTDVDGNGKADSIKEDELNAGYSDRRFFYTARDGGMVFRTPIDGIRTSSGTKYVRTELRGMLRAGDRSIKTKGVNKNNWVLSTSSRSNQRKAGGVDGDLKATLKVDHVTTSGDDWQVGRVIIGQIHANDDEPARLYYRKLPGNRRGSIYVAHEPRKGKERYVELIGSRSDNAGNPSDGIALGEKFSYRISAVGHNLTVTISRPGKPDVVRRIDMSKSGYADDSQYFYFKAGAYNQNNTGRGDDYVQVTFYELNATHS